jgi:hypothetical protein
LSDDIRPIIAAGLTPTLTLRSGYIQTLNGVIDATGGAGKLNVILYSAAADNATNRSVVVGTVNANRNILTNGGDLTISTGLGTYIKASNFVTNGGAVQFTPAVLSGSGRASTADVFIANAAGFTINTDNLSGVAGDISFSGKIDSGNAYIYANNASDDTSWTTAFNSSLNWGVNNPTQYATLCPTMNCITRMATISSGLENSIVGATAGFNGIWLAGRRDSGGGSNWYWVKTSAQATNPAANGAVHFFTQGGSAVNGAYTNFASGEPNGGGVPGSTNEGYLQIAGPLGSVDVSHR